MCIICSVRNAVERRAHVGHTRGRFLRGRAALAEEWDDDSISAFDCDTHTRPIQVLIFGTSDDDDARAGGVLRDALMGAFWREERKSLTGVFFFCF